METMIKKEASCWHCKKIKKLYRLLTTADGGIMKALHNERRFLRATGFAGDPGSYSVRKEEMTTQDPQYHIEEGRLVNTITRIPIPADEPIFIFRAQDRHVARLLRYYWWICEDELHKEKVYARLCEMQAFAEKYPERMKEPDTDASIID